MVDPDTPIPVPGDLDRRRAEARRDAVEAAAIVAQWMRYCETFEATRGDAPRDLVMKWLAVARALADAVDSVNGGKD